MNGDGGDMERAGSGLEGGAVHYCSRILDYKVYDICFMCSIAMPARNRRSLDSSIRLILTSLQRGGLLRLPYMRLKQSTYKQKP